MKHTKHPSWHGVMPLTITAVIVGAAALAWMRWGEMAMELLAVTLKLVVIP